MIFPLGVVIKCSGLRFPYTIEQLNYSLELSKNAYYDHSIPDHVFTLENEKGLKAKIFTREDKVIVAFRGTVINPFDPKVSDYNKEIDNKMFEYCGDENCLQKNLDEVHKYGYIEDSVILVKKIKKIFKEKRIILTGHSLGGSVAAIVGRILNEEVLAFSSPGEKQVSDLFTKGVETKITHLGSCSDSIFMGNCGRLCQFFGYHVETACHSGKSFCIYNPLPRNILFHKIDFLQYEIKPEMKLIEIECKRT